MRSLDVVYKESAMADLLEAYTWVYEASRDPATAQQFVDRLIDACERIGHAPNGGRARDDLVPGLRTIPFERRAVITYVVENDVVVVTNVFYGGRNFEALLQGG